MFLACAYLFPRRLNRSAVASTAMCLKPITSLMYQMEINRLKRLALPRLKVYGTFSPHWNFTWSDVRQKVDFQPVHSIKCSNVATHFNELHGFNISHCKRERIKPLKHFLIIPLHQSNFWLQFCCFTYDSKKKHKM